MAKVTRVIIYEGADEAALNECLSRSLGDGVRQLPGYNITVCTVDDDRKLKDYATKVLSQKQQAIRNAEAAANYPMDRSTRSKDVRQAFLKVYDSICLAQSLNESYITGTYIHHAVKDEVKRLLEAWGYTVTELSLGNTFRIAWLA